MALPKPTGPLVLVVSTSKQTVTVYDDGKQIAKSPISSGTSSNPTPTGIFSILEKNRYHYSNLYGGAPMPFMQRVTNSGVALHAGDLPGYPASHGCIRLPYSFARSLFGITDVGARVIISDEDLTPAEFNSPALIAPLAPDSGAQVSHIQLRSAPQLPGMPASRARAVRPPSHAPPSATGSPRLSAKRKTPSRPPSIRPRRRRLPCRTPRRSIRKERNEEGRLVELARKAVKAADGAAGRFTELTAKMSKIDATTLAAADLEKQSTEELAEEKAMLDAADAAVAAKRAADAQAAKAKQAVADVGALEKARKIALEDVTHADADVARSKEALVAAEALEARKDSPVSVFISAKTGRLIAKLGFAQVLDVPVTIAEPGKPLGTHVLTATAFTDGEKALRWNAVTMKPVGHGTVFAPQEAPP